MAPSAEDVSGLLRGRIRLVCSAHRPAELPAEGRRVAAVMVLLYEDAGEEQLIFQLRTHRVRHHKGEISFPGGARDPGDESLLHTALRETHEEIGVEPEDIEVFGALDDMITIGSDYFVRPYVGAITPRGAYDFSHAPSEVRELLRVPLAHLLSVRSHVWKLTDRDGIATPTPAYRWRDHVIWGATARMLRPFLALVGDGANEARSDLEPDAASEMAT